MKSIQSIVKHLNEINSPLDYKKYHVYCYIDHALKCKCFIEATSITYEYIISLIKYAFTKEFEANKQKDNSLNHINFSNYHPKSGIVTGILNKLANTTKVLDKKFLDDFMSFGELRRALVHNILENPTSYKNTIKTNNLENEIWSVMNIFENLYFDELKKQIITFIGNDDNKRVAVTRLICYSPEADNTSEILKETGLPEQELVEIVSLHAKKIYPILLKKLYDSDFIKLKGMDRIIYMQKKFCKSIFA